MLCPFDVINFLFPYNQLCVILLKFKTHSKSTHLLSKCHGTASAKFSLSIIHPYTRQVIECTEICMDPLISFIVHIHVCEL